MKLYYPVKDTSIDSKRQIYCNDKQFALDTKHDDFRYLRQFSVRQQFQTDRCKNRPGEIRQRQRIGYSLVETIVSDHQTA